MMKVMVLTPRWQARFEESFGTPLGRVRFHCGLPGILRPGEDTLARATDPETVALAPVWWALPPPARLAVIAHELAHIVQLARKGDDPVEALESEAWDAAVAALANKRFDIRGAASRPLDAKAFVAANMAPAKPYYDSFPQEPIGTNASIAVDSATLVAATASALFSTLRRNCRRGDVVLIVAHSSEHGVALRLVAGSQFGLNVENTNRIMTALDRPQAARAAAVGELARDARLTGEAASALLADIAAVRALGLAAVHFRGCNLGAWEDTPRTFRQLFGCPLVTGLKLRSAYAPMPAPQILAGLPQTRTSSSRRPLRGQSAGRTVTEGVPGSRFRYRYTVDPTRHTLTFSNVVAESRQSVAQFILRNLPPPRGAQAEGSFSIHALISVGDLIFPYANGRPNGLYTTQIETSRPSTDIL
jgi:hypothetical protein